MKELVCLLALALSYSVCAQEFIAHNWNEADALKYLPEQVGKLDARGAKNLDSLFQELPKFKNITWLNMWGLAIEGLPETIFDSLTNLQFLDLGNNKLKYLPKSFDKLVELTHLGLYGNRLTELPKAINNFELKALRVQGNQLSGTFTISHSWKYLKELDLAGNKIDSIHGLKYLKKVERLSLRACAFEELPDEFQNCRKLELFYIDHNPIETLPKSLLKLHRLRYILLEKTNIPDEVLRKYKMKYPKTSFDTCPTC